MTLVWPVTLVWRHPDGRTRYRRCRGFVEAMEHAARVAAGADGP